MNQLPNEDALVLVVDDDPGARMLARAALEQIGLRVEEADDGLQALRSFEAHRPDLLLLDMIMPGMDGFATCAALRSTPGGRDIPVLVMTALDDVESLARAYEAGATDFIGKPVRHVVLQHRVRYMLRATHTTGQLRDSQQRLARAQRIAGLVSWEWDPRSDAVWVSDEFQTMFGVQPGRTRQSIEVDRWVHPQDRERVYGEFQRAMEQSSPVSLEHRVLLSDGTERFVYHQAEPVGDPGGVKWVGTLQDITERIALRRQLMHADRLIAVGQLAAGVAHEVNNPASFVLINLSLIQEHLLPIEAAFEQLRRGANQTHPGSAPAPSVESTLAEHNIDFRLTEIKEMLAENLEGMERIVGIVKDLGNFSRVERDEREEIDINEVVQAACNMTANEIRHRGRLIKDLGRCPTILADRGKIAQVATNLLINAAQAIHDKPAADNEIRISTRHIDDKVVLRVEDTGGGVPQALRDRIFDPFFTTKRRGSGLGLSLSMDIVRKHDGEIRLVRSDDTGTLFEVVLPARLEQSSRTTSSTHTALPTTSRHHRILLVDDEPALLSAFRRTLGRTNDLVVALGGNAALATLKQDAAFDVVICDLMMPDVDGIFLYEWIRHNYPELRQRIIFYTGGAFTPKAKEFTSVVDCPVISKPIDWTRLTSLIESITAD